MSPKFKAVVAALAVVVAGCSLSKPDQRPGSDPNASPANTILGRLGVTGQVIEPKRCALKMVILPRPLRDKAVNDAVWSAADEQVLPPELRRALEANGLRAGVLTGGLPADVETAVNAPPPNKIDPAEFNMPAASNTLVALCDAVPEASLLLNRDGHAFGKPYKEASGWLRVTADHNGPTGVALRIVPEIHHGPIQRRFDSLPKDTATHSSMQFMLKDGQQEETLRDLAASLTLQPGQILAIGCDPDRRGTLGSFLFTQPEPNSDRLMQKVLLVWASRTNLGEPGSQPKPGLLPVDPPELPGHARKDEIDKKPLKDKEVKS